ncbi:hypothetical protein QYE76_047395 [Lolium multiflorum]|uniref:AP2/ERF domain-containing protein n=1 Tax=Lolium multiflorum TaxID=4521 RepID=A0AAD8TRP1_LOLMU|nr:hypothetical protein QYE76_047395 [Lolium multiflorum]
MYRPPSTMYLPPPHAPPCTATAAPSHQSPPCTGHRRVGLPHRHVRTTATAMYGHRRHPVYWPHRHRHVRGHRRHRHRLATTVTAMYEPPPCTAHHRHRYVQATVATAVYWPPPPPPPPCKGTSHHRHRLATTVTAMYGPPSCTGHHRHRHVLPTTATATRVPSPCHVSLPHATCRRRFHVPRPAATSATCVRNHTSPSPPFIRRRDAAAPSRLVRFRGVRARPNGRFYAEMRAGGFRLTLGTYNTPELAAHAYDAAAWRFRRPRCDMNFPDVESLEEAEFLAPTPCLVDARTVAATARCSAGSPSPSTTRS